MPSDSAETALRDIRYHVELAQAFVAGLDAAAFCDDLRTVYAVTRCLDIISEASRRLPSSLKERHPSIEVEAHGQRGQRVPASLRGRGG
jgi:uncharacterized protein with HEPN domain